MKIIKKLTSPLDLPLVGCPVIFVRGVEVSNINELEEALRVAPKVLGSGVSRDNKDAKASPKGER